MLRLLLSFLLIWSTAGYTELACTDANGFPRFALFGGIDANELFRTPNDIMNPCSPFRGPLDVALQKPQSYRTHYSCFTGPNTNARSTLPGSAGITLNALHVTMRLLLVAAPSATKSVNFKFAHPNLEIDPYRCSTAGVVSSSSLGGNCRCDVAFDDAVVTGSIQAVSFTTSKSTLNIPTATYFEHSPFPGQNPYLRTYRKLCMQTPQDAAEGFYQDTTIWIAVTHCCDTANSQGTSCADANKYHLAAYSWNSVTAGATTTFFNLPVTSGAPTAISTNRDTTLFFDPLLATEVSANPNAYVCSRALGFLGAFFDLNVPTGTNPATISNIQLQTSDNGVCWGETAEMTLARQKRTVCCGARSSSSQALDYVGFTTGATKFGTCINPVVESCCGFKPYDSRYETCCSKVKGLINHADQPCKCSSETIADDCLSYGPNVNERGEADALASRTTRDCCLMTKYPEFLNLKTDYTGSFASLPENRWLPRTGMCYDLTNTTVKCCDDGQIYDPGTAQCCPINGVQSLNVPCPCGRDSDCTDTTNYMCCIQQFPRSWEDGQGPVNALGSSLSWDRSLDSLNSAAAIHLSSAQYSAPAFQSQCDKYANWPDGYGLAEVQRCPGNCINKLFQICCNGAVCARDYDRCCNSTCCNRFTSGCMEGTRPGSRGFGGRVNPKDFNIYYESCTSVEVFTTRRAFWVWVMPTFWVIASVVALAVVTVVGRRATENSFPLTERCLVFFTVLLIGLCIPHYFSPTYKYGIVIVFTSMFVLLGAVLQSKKMSLVTIFLVVLMLLLWVDPFEGNIYLSLTGGISPVVADELRLGGQTSQDSATNNIFSVNILQPKYTSGILEALFRLERNRAECTGFYDYFVNDVYIHDMERFMNPNKPTFGFCTRAWMTTLLIFSIVSIALLLVILMLAIFSFAKKVLPKTIKDEIPYELPLDAAPLPYY